MQRCCRCPAPRDVRARAMSIAEVSESSRKAHLLAETHTVQPASPRLLRA